MKLFVVILLLIGLANCSQQTAKLPQSPVNSQNPNPQSPPPSSCALAFTAGMSRSEIAQMSYRMQKECSLSETQILGLINASK